MHPNPLVPLTSGHLVPLPLSGTTSQNTPLYFPNVSQRVLTISPGVSPAPQKHPVPTMSPNHLDSPQFLQILPKWKLGWGMECGWLEAVCVVWGPCQPLSLPPSSPRLHPSPPPTPHPPTVIALKQNWDQMTHHTLPRARLRDAQLGQGRGEGHKGHLPRRQRMVRRGGGFIPGEGREAGTEERSCRKRK